MMGRRSHRRHFSPSEGSAHKQGFIQMDMWINVTDL